MEKYLGPGESVWERLPGARQKGPDQKSSLGHRPLQGSRPGPSSPWYPGYAESQANMPQKNVNISQIEFSQPWHSRVDGKNLKFK
jgi:hypothetical protein